MKIQIKFKLHPLVTSDPNTPSKHCTKAWSAFLDAKIKSM